MEGTLVVKEERGVIEKFRDWYKEKVIDTNISQNSEKILDWGVNLGTKANEVMSSIASVILSFVPEADVIVPILPDLSKVTTGFYQFGKNTILKAKRAVEAKFIGVDGSCEDVVVPAFNEKETIDSAELAAKTVKSMIDIATSSDDKIKSERGGMTI